MVESKSRLVNPLKSLIVNHWDKRFIPERLMEVLNERLLCFTEASDAGLEMTSGLWDPHVMYVLAKSFTFIHMKLCSGPLAHKVQYSLRYLFSSFLFLFCVCQVLEAWSSSLLAPAESSGGTPTVCSHPIWFHSPNHPLEPRPVVATSKHSPPPPPEQQGHHHLHTHNPFLL